MYSEKLLRELLSKRDPLGYYVIPVGRNALELLEQRYGGSFVAEEAGDTVFIKVASRSSAERIARFLLSRGLLRSPR